MDKGPLLHSKAMNQPDLRKPGRSQEKSIDNSLIEKQLFDMFLNTYKSKENIRMLRTINNLNTQLQKVSESCILPSYSSRSSQCLPKTILQTDSPDHPNGDCEKPLINLHKKLQAIERCWIDNGSQRKIKRRVRPECRSKTNSFYHANMVELSSQLETPKQKPFTPFQHYNFGNDNKSPEPDESEMILHTICDQESDSLVKEFEQKWNNEKQNVTNLRQMLENQQLEKDELLDQLKELRKLNFKLSNQLIKSKQRFNCKNNSSEDQSALSREKAQLQEQQEKLRKERQEMEQLKAHLYQRELDLNLQQEKQIQEFQKIKATIKELKKEIVFEKNGSRDTEQIT